MSDGLSHLIAFRLLIVDDNPDEFPLLEAGFSEQNQVVHLQTITIAHLALVEVALCENSEKPHAALVDINMPAIDGFGLAREFIGNGLPTVLMSTDVSDERRMRAAAIGALDLLPKPINAAGYADFAKRVLALMARHCNLQDQP